MAKTTQKNVFRIKTYKAWFPFFLSSNDEVEIKIHV